MYYVWLYDDHTYVGPFATTLAARDWAVQVKLTNLYTITQDLPARAKVIPPIRMQVQS